MTALHPRHLAGVSLVEFYGRNTVRLEASRLRTFRVKNPVRFADYLHEHHIAFTGKFIPADAPRAALNDAPCTVCEMPTAGIICLGCTIDEADDALAQAMHDATDAWMQHTCVQMVDALDLAGLNRSGLKLVLAKRLAYYNVATPDPYLHEIGC